MRELARGFCITAMPPLVALAISTLLPPAHAQALDSVKPLSEVARAAMTGHSWNTDCPVPLDDLVEVSVGYVDFDGGERTGTMVVHQRFGGDVAAIFAELHAARFPIRNVSPYETYGPGLYAEQDATVGFYCQRAQDDPGSWSSHAYGFAIDINPLENPFLDAKEGWWPALAAKNAPRDGEKGKIVAGSEAFLIFARHGWAWGGFYPQGHDYMHFYKYLVGSAPSPLDRQYEAPALTYRPSSAR